jgi:hypothetical protein
VLKKYEKTKMVHLRFLSLGHRKLQACDMEADLGLEPSVCEDSGSLLQSTVWPSVQGNQLKPRGSSPLVDKEEHGEATSSGHRKKEAQEKLC